MKQVFCDIVTGKRYFKCFNYLSRLDSDNNRGGMYLCEYYCDDSGNTVERK